MLDIATAQESHSLEPSDRSSENKPRDVFDDDFYAEKEENEESLRKVILY